MSPFRLSLIFVVATILNTNTSFAVGVDYQGYFRTRANFFNNLDLDRSESPEIRAFTDFRFRLDPTFFVTDKVRVKTSLNFLDGVMGDAPFRGVPHSNPATSQDFGIHNTDNGNVGRVTQSANMTNWVYGGAQAPDAAVTTSELKPLYMRRAWVEVETPIGLVKAGRMPFQFGMGLFGNAGDAPDQEIGSTRDRLAFETGFGNYYLEPGVSWFNEGKLDRSQDDAYEYYFHFGRKVEGEHLAMYLAYFNQDEALDATANGGLKGTKSHYWTIAFYAQHQFSLVNAQLEANFFTGRYLGYDLLAINAAGKLDWDFRKIDLITEVGFSSGTSDEDAARQDVRTVAFNRDYNVSYLVFEEAIPGGAYVPGDSGDQRQTTPHSGAISNAIYGRLRADFDVSKIFKPSINVVVPFAHQKSNGAGGLMYGVEYDLITKWPVLDYLTGELTFAHFIPGSFYDNVSKSQSTFLLLGGMTVEF